MALKLEWRQTGEWKVLADTVTNQDGRVPELLPKNHKLERGTYRLTFETGAYFEKKSQSTFYPVAIIVFDIDDAKQHYHVPLLISGHGYSTYRGS